MNAAATRHHSGAARKPPVKLASNNATAKPLTCPGLMPASLNTLTAAESCCSTNFANSELHTLSRTVRTQTVVPRTRRSQEGPAIWHLAALSALLSTPLDSSIAPSRTRMRCDSPRSACPLWDLPMLAAALSAVHLFQRWRTVPLYRHLQLHLQAAEKGPYSSRTPLVTYFRLTFLARKHYAEAGYTFVNTQITLHSCDLCGHLHGKGRHPAEIRVCPRLLIAVCHKM